MGIFSAPLQPKRLQNQSSKRQGLRRAALRHVQSDVAKSSTVQTARKSHSHDKDNRWAGDPMSEIGRASRKEAQVLGWVVILGLLIAVVWYVIASDYSYDGITGTYVQRSTTEDSTLILKNDQHFEQEVTHDGVTQRAHGTWRRLGEGRIVLSP